MPAQSSAYSFGPKFISRGPSFLALVYALVLFEDAATYPAVWPSAVLNPMTDSWMCEVVCVFDAQMTGAV